MGATYVRAEHRDTRPEWRRRPVVAPLMLAVAALFIFASSLGFVGRTRAFDRLEAGLPAPVNLAERPSVELLEPVVARAFPQPADRRVAAVHLHGALESMAPAGALVNVGALASIRVPVAALARMPAGSVLAARRDERVSPAASGDEPSMSEAVPLFLPADVAAIKAAVSVRTRESHRNAVVWSVVAIVVAFLCAALITGRRQAPADALLLGAAWLLVTCGFLVMLTRPDPLRDTVLVVRFAQGVVLGVGLYVLATFVNVRRLSYSGLSYLPLAAAVVLALVLAVFGSGPGTSDTRINLGPTQPMELIRLLMALFLAGYFGRRWEVIRQVRAASVRHRPLPRWLNVPRVDLVLPVAVGVAAALALFVVLRDLGPALLLSIVFLAMFAVARARVGLALGGLAVLVGGVAAGAALGVSSTLSARVAMWWSPWENAVRGGDQVAHALWALASGAGAGTGLGLGATRFVPAGHTDLALAAVAEELGAVGVLAVVAAFSAIAWQGIRISRRASTDYAVFLAMAMTLSLTVPALVMAAGLLGIVPLTGVVTPFVSYGGSAMLANFAALGLLTACRERAATNPATVPFGKPSRWLLRAMAAAAVVLVVAWGRVQLVSADAYLVRPQLGRQADGGLRYQYNPRVLDAVGVVSRGTVFDRTGLALATDDRSVAEADSAAFGRLGIDVGDRCASASRCYPLGGEAFHLVGDATTRANWSASNTSYVERDAGAHLRGYDDRAATVRTSVDDRAALRRDFSPVVPLVRHRWDPDHPAALAVLEASRDIHVTIDARLQHRVATILARAVTAARVEKGAAVVVDADTGDLLASASYPWPVHGALSVDPDAALDRARYGLYAPGSTFKLVTAAAALRTRPELAGLPLVCARLPGARVGARIAGHGRPVRDDVRDREPHGAITLHDGLVRSCNAYFAQLAVELGPAAMIQTSAAAGIALAATDDEQVVRDNLPHAGYGQGQVVTTPLRMARLAAAIGTDGTLREAPLVVGSAPAVETPFLDPKAASVLAGYMRDAVTSGTGRALARHAVAIAGKTGTAEVDGAPSHAWFVGFAPHGRATRRIAFAVILEHAGYGGVSAAAASGEIVTAARDLGFVQ